MDRNDKTSRFTRGGRVAIIVNKQYQIELINIPIDNAEQLFILIRNGKNIKCILGVCYIPPLSTVDS